MALTVLDLCSGAGGEAVGLEAAGFANAAAIELDRAACATLRLNRPSWAVLQRDLREVDGTEFRGVDLVAAGVPCPPFSIAGKQLGPQDERDQFPAALRIIGACRPRAVLIENVRGLMADRFRAYRMGLNEVLAALGYEMSYRVVNACDFGVPQLRPRFVLVGLRPEQFSRFRWPEPMLTPPTVGQAIGDLMAQRGWAGAEAWKARAARIAPTIVGGSKKHGGPDLGPTRAWRERLPLGVDGLGVADEPPGPETPANALPRLTVRMAARLQGFGDEWRFAGEKSAAHKQVGKAFPPPVALQVGSRIAAALTGQAAGAARATHHDGLFALVE